MATEQQMSNNENAGWIASSHATTPPTGIVPSVVPDGQASGITAPATIVGTSINASMCCATAAMLARSNSFSASISIENWRPFVRINVSISCRACSATKIASSSAPPARMMLAVFCKSSSLNQRPGRREPGNKGVAVNGLRYAHGFASTSFFSRSVHSMKGRPWATLPVMRFPPASGEPAC